MKMKMRTLFYALLGVVLFSGATLFAIPNPGNVLVVYNSAYTGDYDGDGVQDSLQIAQYYAAVRGVPANHVFGVATTAVNVFPSFEQFRNELLIPVRNKLNALGPDSIDVILLCYALPWSVPTNGAGFSLAVDDVMKNVDIQYASVSGQVYSGNSYYEGTPGFGTDHGRFDHATYKSTNGTPLYMTSRIGWSNVQQGFEQIDAAQYGERYISKDPGYYGGIAYVNSRYGFSGGRYTDAFLRTDSEVMNGSCYSYESADKCMAYAEHYITAAGWPLKWQNMNTTQLIGNPTAQYSDGTPALTAPDALFYSGWYVQRPAPFSLKAGSVWNDLSSFSMRGENQQALEQGAAATTGSVYEPYLGGTPRPEVMLFYILKGYTFVESAMASIQPTSWMTVSVGDPLYTPLKSKTLVKDTVFPVLEPGFPTVSANSVATSRTINVKVKNTPEPEAVQVYVDYGLTTSYGSTINPVAGFWRRHNITIPSVAANSTYHYRLRMVDPVGNTTTTGDYVFYTGTAQVATSINIRPRDLVLGAGTGQQYAGTVLDQLGNPLVPQPTLRWTAEAGAGSMNLTGFLAGSAIVGGPFTVTAATAATGSLHGTTTVTLVNQVMTSVAVTPAVVSLAPNRSVTFSARAYDQFGKLMLPQPLFGWSTNGGSINSSGQYIAGASPGGPYVVTAVSHEMFATASVRVLAPVIYGITVTPAGPSLGVNETLQMRAVATDQFGNALTTQPTFSWRTEAGTINTSGLFTAPGSTRTVNVSATAGSITGLTTLIVTNLPIINFTSTSANVDEDAGSVALTVKRHGAATGATAVNYATQNGTAVSGSDYTAISGSLTWNDGDMADKTINVQVSDDALAEPTETFTVVLTPNGSALGDPKLISVKILDDDFAEQPGQLRFGTATRGVMESAGTVDIPVQRVNGSHGGVSVQYASSNGTALAGSDYTAASGTLSWADNDVATKTISIPIANDSLGESDEVFILTLSSPVTGGAALGAPIVSTITIVDDDGTAAPPVINSGPTATPSSVVMPATVALSVTATDPSNLALTYTWSVDSGPSSVYFNPNGTGANSTTAAFNLAGTYVLRVTVTNGVSSAAGTVTVIVTGTGSGNIPPTVVNAASASPNPTSGTNTGLTVLGADDAGEARLIYTWAASSKPASALNPTFSVNGTNPSKNTTVTFLKAGFYTLRCTIEDSSHLSVTSSVDVNVIPTITRLAVTPSNASVVNGDTITFTGRALDQFSDVMTGFPSSSIWTVSGGGSITTKGVFTATTVGGPYTVTTQLGGFLGTATVTVTSGPVAPTVTTQPTDISVIEGNSATFTVQATGTGVLSYQWRRDGTNIPGAVRNTYTTAATSLADSGDKFSVVVTNSVGTATSRDAVLTVNPLSAANVAPSVDAGGNQTVSLLIGANLNGRVSDDGLPTPPGAVTTEWTQISGPGIVTFANPTHAVTLASFSQAGIYLVRLTADDGGLIASDDAQIVVTTPGSGDPGPSPSGGTGSGDNFIFVNGKSPIRFFNLAPGTHVVIYSRKGEKVREWSGVSGTLEWSATSQNGENVVSGVYWATVESSAGNSKRKLVVVR